MPAGGLPYRRRLVSVKADLGAGAKQRYKYGSGLIIGSRQVLTAAHVLTGAREVTVRRPGDTDGLAATLESALVGDPDQCDLAIIDVPGIELFEHWPVAIVRRDLPRGGLCVEDCWATGYPAFARVKHDERALRDTEDVTGVIKPLSGLNQRLLYLDVTVAPRRQLPGEGEALDRSSEWSGMSGSAAFASGLLVGVVTEHLPGRGASQITVTPLDRLSDTEYGPANAVEWWTRLGVSDLLQ